MDVQQYKDALLRKRGEIVGTGGIKPLQASMETTTRQGDMADQARGNNEVNIQLKLKQTDAKILQAIEEALRRIEKGTYGVCRDCGEPIAEAPLGRIPWARGGSPRKEKRNPGVACSRCCRTFTARSWRCYWDIRRRRGSSVCTTSTTPISTSSPERRRSFHGWRRQSGS